MSCTDYADPDVEPIVGTIIGGRCVVLRVPADTRSSHEPARVALIDLRDSTQFALYFDPTPLPTTAGSDASLRPLRTRGPASPRVIQSPPPKPAANWDALLKSGHE
jgi:hypothetical protein